MDTRQRVRFCYDPNRIGGTNNPYPTVVVFRGDFLRFFIIITTVEGGIGGSYDPVWIVANVSAADNIATP